MITYAGVSLAFIPAIPAVRAETYPKGGLFCTAIFKSFQSGVDPVGGTNAQHIPSLIHPERSEIEHTEVAHTAGVVVVNPLLLVNVGKVTFTGLNVTPKISLQTYFVQCKVIVSVASAELYDGEEVVALNPIKYIVCGDDVDIKDRAVH
jgi:hypothetical protein